MTYGLRTIASPAPAVVQAHSKRGSCGWLGGAVLGSPKLSRTLFTR